MAGAAPEPDSIAHLRGLLVRESSVDKRLATFIVTPPPDGFGVESVSDYASFFTKADYAECVQVDIVDR
eukprot:4493883-Prorocentrum_lima.AAC.1